MTSIQLCPRHSPTCILPVVQQSPGNLRHLRKTSHLTIASRQYPSNTIHDVSVAWRPFTQDFICGPNFDEKEMRHNFQAITERPHCYALVWIQERSSSSKTNPVFSICYSKGQVILPHIMPYDKIMDLLRRKRLCREIRKYNSEMAYACTMQSGPHSCQH